jgi:hypothetical protein
MRNPNPRYTRHECETAGGHYAVGTGHGDGCWRCGVALGGPVSVTVVPTPSDVPDPRQKDLQRT